MEFIFETDVERALKHKMSTANMSEEKKAGYILRPVYSKPYCMYVMKPRKYRTKTNITKYKQTRKK